MKNRLNFCTSIFLLALLSTTVNAYPRNLFAVTPLHYDSVRAPHGLDWYLQSREATVIISSISGAMGINPAYVTLATQASPSATPVGEETNYVVPVEPGYTYCATRLKVTSIVPADGERASTINAAVNSNELQMSTWTPVRHFGEGNSWVEGDIQVYGIKPEYLDEFVNKGVCKKVTTQVAIISCRGKSTCGEGVTHGDPLGAGPTTPDLSSGF